jgi:hypothetical protein
VVEAKADRHEHPSSFRNLDQQERQQQFETEKRLNELEKQA